MIAAEQRPRLIAFPSLATLWGRPALRSLLVAAVIAPSVGRTETSPGIRAAIPRATTSVEIDGRLDEYADAFCAPVEYFHPDIRNRAGQFFFLWDDEAFYVGLRTLDQQQFSPEHPLWEGDAVEWYFDTRRGPEFLNREWGRGSVHCFFTPMHKAELQPRFCLRPGYEDAIEKIGVKTAARRTPHGLEVEFRLPWANFPDFQAAVGQVIGIDAELSYSDGGPRSGRSFVFGNPLSVQQPANLARVELVDEFNRQHWRASGPVLMPLRVDVPWKQETLPRVHASIAVPPVWEDQIGRIVFQVSLLQGDLVGEYEAERRVAIEEDGNFAIRQAFWATDVAPAGRYQVAAVVYDPSGAELTRVAPRLVSVNMQPGY